MRLSVLVGTRDPSRPKPPAVKDSERHRLHSIFAGSVLLIIPPVCDALKHGGGSSPGSPDFSIMATGRDVAGECRLPVVPGGVLQRGGGKFNQIE